MRTQSMSQKAAKQDRNNEIGFDFFSDFGACAAERLGLYLVAAQLRWSQLMVGKHESLSMSFPP